MKASEQLAKWISDDNDLFGTSQDEILKLVFQYPAVASYKLMLAKWQFLRHGAVEEGLWQQLLLQWPNPTQLFEWRSKSFDFIREIELSTFQSNEINELPAEENLINESPGELSLDWGKYLEEMQLPVSFVWELPEKIEIVAIEELPVFEFLLQTETEIEPVPTVEEFKITDDLPIKKEEEIIEQKPWSWATYVEDNLDHIFSVWISEATIEISQVEEIQIELPMEVEIVDTEEEQETIANSGKKDIFSVQSSAMDSTEEFQPSAFVQWLQSQKQLQVNEKTQQAKVKPVTLPVAQKEDKEEKKHKPEKDKVKEKNKEKDKPKKKDKKKKKHKKKDKLEEEIFSSLEFSDDVASETYAALLAKQGHYELSERIYERLRLIYPEKSSYFAGLIKKLKS